MLFWVAVLIAAGALVLLPGLLFEGSQRYRKAVLARSDGPNYANIKAVIVLAWVYSVVPATINLFHAGRGSVITSEQVAATGIAGALSTVLSLTITAICVQIIITHLRVKPERNAAWMVPFLLPWFALEVISGVAKSEPFGRQVIFYPLIAFAFWLVGPPIQVFRPLGWLTIVTAVGSLIFGLSSSLAFFTGGLGVTDKSIFGGNRLLAGPYTHSNQLGLVLALGLPAVLMLRSKVMRLIGVTLVVIVTAWAAARTSLLADQVVLLTYLVIRSGKGRRFAVLLTIGAVAAVVSIPLSTTDPLSFSRRGQLWIASLQHWHDHIWTGNGSLFFRDIAIFDNSLGPNAFHAHNLYMQVLVTGGVVAVAAMAVFLIAAIRRAYALRNTPFGLLYVLAFVMVGILEVVVNYGNLGTIGCVVWLPLAGIFFGRDTQASESCEPRQVTRAEPAIALPPSAPRSNWKRTAEADATNW